MNPNLKVIQDLLQQNESLTQQQREALLKAIADAEKQWNITEFKLDRTEQVKKTTAILLEETIEELEQKRKAVEAQKHELEIETALERVRAIAMGMMQPADMLAVCKTISHQLALLNVKEIRNVQTAIFYEGKGTYMNYEYYAKHDKTFITETTYTNNEIHNAFATQMLKGTGEIFISHIKGDEVKDWIAYQKTTNVFIDSFLETASSLNYYWFSLGTVALGISTYSPLQEEDIDLFKRFRNVFELSYRRYLDIETALAQAREAQIEAALEKVRARAMAMHASEELKEVVKELRKQIGLLGEDELNTCVIQLYEESPDYIQSWVSINSEEITEFTGTVSKKGLRIIEESLKAYSSGRKDYTLLNEKAKLKQWMGFLEETYPASYAAIIESYNGLKPEEVPAHWSFSDFSGGSLLMVTLAPPGDISRGLLRKFANVFGLAYRRFVDLKQAEAQARESQIQLALERVRARTMAMQKSEELANVATVLFQQVKALGVPQWVCGFCIWDIGDTECMWYSGSADGEILPPARFPLNGHPVFRIMDESRKRGDELYILEKEGELQADHYRYMMTLPVVRELLQHMLDAGLTIPAFQIDHYANFAYGNLIFITYEHFPEMHEVFKRFAKVFEQTYTRFLDLQKAEAQARESQIQLALERVRARTMAMQRSDELPEAATLLFQQVQSLGAPSWTAGYCIFDEDKKAITLSMSRPWGDIQPSFRAPLDENPSFIRYLEAHNKGLELYIEEISGEALEQNYKYLLTLPVVGEQLASIIAEGHTFPTYEVDHCAYFSKGFLLFITYQQVPELHDVFKRFASVFDQTYTRFLDLQKAEAQARESQIQLALERVRARTMAMRESSELAEVASLMFEQLSLLGASLWICGFHICKKDSEIMEAWVCPPDGKMMPPMYLPYTVDQFSKAAYETWKNHGKLHTDIIEGIELQKSHGELMKQPSMKIARNHLIENKITMPTWVQRFAVAYTFGYLMIVTTKLFKETDVLLRLAKVFEQTYTRFLDLQKAEAQAREAQVEAALERVRSRTLAMQKSDELIPAAELLFDQLKQLGAELQGVAFAICDKNSLMVKKWTSIGIFSHPYNIEPGEERMYEAWKNQEGLYEEVYEGERQQKYYEAFMEIPEFKQGLQKFIDSGYPLPTWQKNHAVTFKYGYLLFITLKPFNETEIFIRFGKVFEQTYTRFLDLQKAEAQAREARIEAALEKVRSRSLAMHSSEELKEVIAIVFENLNALNVIMDAGVGICIFSDGSREMLYWVAQPDVLSSPAIFRIPYFEHPMLSGLWEARESGKDSFARAFSFEEKNGFWKYAFEHFEDYKNLPEELKNEVFESEGYAISGAWGKYSGILAASLKGKLYSKEENEVLKRFATVFEQAYVRFLDLQKAEAQAREAQIEAALERVRSHSMAMHQSSDLHEVIMVVTEQLLGLGIKFNVANFAKIFSEGSWDLWISTPDQSYPALVHVPYIDHGLFNNVIEAIEQGRDFVSDVYDQEEKNIFFKHFFENTLAKNTPAERKEYVMNCKGFARSLLLTKNIWLAVSNYDGIPFSNEENAIFKRFANAFEQTYTRFLDLQKAEAQAREARIEAALEKVRARTMGMQHSNELPQAANLLFQQIQSLGMPAWSAGYCIWDKDKQGITAWMSSEDVLQPPFKAPLTEDPSFIHMREAYERGETFYVEEVGGEELVKHYQYMRRLPVVGAILDSIIETGHPLPVFQIFHLAFFSQGFLLFITYEPVHEAHDIFKRFGKVFDQTYTRFLDLQKAEAQAREAQIEAALERVRAKVMSMRSSEDLNETIKVFYHQLESLSLTPRRCGVGLLNKENRTAELSTMNTTADGQTIELIGKLDMSMHPVLEGVYNGWLKQEEYTPVLRGNEIKEYYKILRPQIYFPDYPDDAVQYGYFFFFDEGGVYAWTEKQMEETELQIYRRFTSVFNLTYKRYKDLKKAEANAKEAVKQAALDRIRADIASMRSVSDLDRITPLIWNELTILGIPFIRCGVFLMDDAQQLVHTFLSAPDGRAIAAFHMPYNTPGNLGKVIDHWQEKRNYIDHWSENEFMSLADILVKQGSIANREEYLSSLPHDGFHLHFLPFLQGMLYVGNTTQLEEEAIKLLQSVADAFSTAYARYEDFNKLEAAKKQVDSTLTELQATQKQLIQSEKMASLGELTAGIAHEIQNPLNFVNNFSEVSNELVDEMKEELATGNLQLATEIAEDIRQNLEKINHHGKRADAIVKGMLQHSRASSGQKEPTDINALCDEYLRLAYHGLRAKDKSFNADFKTDFDAGIGKVNVVPQDIGRVLLNLFNNAFYAVNERYKEEGERQKALNPIPSTLHLNYKPTVSVQTKKINDTVEIIVADNGNGIPQNIVDKIFQPFFTTKPTGQGTGLGLSLAYDIIKAHGGEIRVTTKEGEGSEFVIQFPYNP